MEKGSRERKDCVPLSGASLVRDMQEHTGWELPPAMRRGSFSGLLTALGWLSVASLKGSMPPLSATTGPAPTESGAPDAGACPGVCKTGIRKAQHTLIVCMTALLCGTLKANLPALS
jgi:hypothetical protein